MFHLLVMACTEAQICAERWLPQGDRPARGDCLAGAGAVAGAWAAAQQMTAGASRCVPTTALPALDLQLVAPGVWVHRGADETAGPKNGGRIANMGVIVGPAGTVIVDTGGSRAEAEALLAAALRLTPQPLPLPVTAAILTHVHPDHSLGTGFFREAGIPLLAHARLPEALAARRATYEVNYRATIGEAAWHGSGFALPDQTFDAPSEVDLGGGERLVLMPQPTAHSDSDLTVWHPASGTLFTGDLAFRDLTPVLDGSISGWLGWLDAAPESGLRHLVPGHGPVAGGWDEGTSTTRAYLGALADAVRAALAADSPLSAAVPQVVEALRSGAGTLADFDASTRRNAAAAYKELEWE